MLTFEKILKVFQAYLDDDPLYEVVQTSHGYTLMAWEPHRNDWYSAEIQKLSLIHISGKFDFTNCCGGGSNPFAGRCRGW